jgi:hypothetical protein
MKANASYQGMPSGMPKISFNEKRALGAAPNAPEGAKKSTAFGIVKTMP